MSMFLILFRVSTCARHWRLKTGNWRLETGDWKLEPGKGPKGPKCKRWYCRRHAAQPNPVLHTSSQPYHSPSSPCLPARPALQGLVARPPNYWDPLSAIEQNRLFVPTAIRGPRIPTTALYRSKPDQARSKISRFNGKYWLLAPDGDLMMVYTVGRLHDRLLPKHSGSVAEWYQKNTYLGRYLLVSR